MQVPTQQVARTIAGAAAGLGGGDVARRELSDAELVEIVAEQVQDRVQVADEYERHGEHDAARRLRYEADVLRSYVSG